MKLKPSIILKILAMIGVPITAFFAAQSAKDTEEALKLAVNEKPDGEKVTVPEAAGIVAKTQWKALLAGGVTIACQAGAYSLDAKAIAALAGMLSASAYTVKEHKEQLKKIIGKEKYEKLESEVKKAVSLEKLKKSPPNEKDKGDLKPIQGSERQVYFDMLSRSWFIATPLEISEAVIKMNHDLAYTQRYLCNDWVRSLGIESPVKQFGPDDGWTTDLLFEEYGYEYEWIEVYQIQKFTESGEPYTAIAITADPVNIELYEEYVSNYYEGDPKWLIC